MLQPPGSSSSSIVKKKKVTSEEKTKTPASKLARSSTDKPAKSDSDSRSAKSSADTQINEPDQKCSDRFNRLEALLLARTLDRTDLSDCQGHANAHSTYPFIKPANQPQSLSACQLTGTLRFVWYQPPTNIKHWIECKTKIHLNWNKIACILGYSLCDANFRTCCQNLYTKGKAPHYSSRPAKGQQSYK